MATFFRDTTTYKPGFIDMSTDYCKLMENPVITHPLFSVFYKILGKFTPNLHKCPMKKYEEVMLKNCTIDYNLIPMSLLQFNGHFRIDITYYSTKRGESVYYIKAIVYVAVHRRFPYKKRTKP
jgi:hypothetical protein